MIQPALPFVTHLMAWGRYPLQHARLRAYGILLARLSPRSYCHLFYPAIYTQVTSKLHVRWLRSITQITYWYKLIKPLSLAAFLHLKIY